MIIVSVSTSLIQSGAPSTLWGEASEHFVFTRNNIVERKVRNIKRLSQCCVKGDKIQHKTFSCVRNTGHMLHT